jgi:ribosomal protein L37AE/L43A
MIKALNPKCPICEKDVLLKTGAMGSVECPHCHAIFNIGAEKNRSVVRMPLNAQ